MFLRQGVPVVPAELELRDPPGTKGVCTMPTWWFVCFLSFS